jgi:hypothetical protein
MVPPGTDDVCAARVFLLFPDYTFILPQNQEKI